MTLGPYTGSGNRRYTVEIDSVTAGPEVGQATFRWKHSDSAAGWEAAGVLTSTQPVELDSGIRIKWIAGPGRHLEAGDRWRFEAHAVFGVDNLLDLNRDTKYRTAGAGEVCRLTADLGQAVEIGASIILDHNFSSEAVITLEADPAGDWQAPAFAVDLAHHPEIMVSFLDESYRYWRLTVDDPGNPDGCLEFAVWHLGGGVSPKILAGSPQGPAEGRDASSLDWKIRRTFSGEFVVPGRDQSDALAAWFEGLGGDGRRRRTPFFFCADTAEPDEKTWLMTMTKPVLKMVQTGPDSHRVFLDLIEAERSNV